MPLRKAIPVLFAIILAGCGNGYEKVSNISLIPFSPTKAGKWGYINSNGEMVIDTLFTNQPGFFRDGFAVIQNEDGTYDYVDESGRVSTKHYKSAAMFSEGLACVAAINGKPEYINSRFETVIRLPKASLAGMFSEGLAKYQDSTGRWGFIDKSGRIAVKPAYHYAMSFSEGLSAVAVNTKTGIISGYIDKAGKQAIPLSSKYINLRPFSGGLAAYLTAEGWGYMNNIGGTAIKPNSEWAEATDFREGYASVRIANKWGVIDKQGFLIIEAKFDSPVVFYNELAAVSIAGLTGFIDKSGKFAIEPHFDAIALPFVCENAFVAVEGLWRLVNPEGNIIGYTGFKRINAGYEEIFDYDATIASDYFDFAGYSAKIITSIDSTGINGFSRYAVPDSIKDALIGAGYEIDSAGQRFSAEKYKNFNYELLSRNSISITNRGTDSAMLKNYRSVNTLGGNGKGKQDFVIKSILMELMDAGFNFMPDSLRYVFFTDSAAVLLYTHYNDIIVDYYFNRQKHLDSSFKEINK